MNLIFLICIFSNFPGLKFTAIKERKLKITLSNSYYLFWLHISFFCDINWALFADDYWPLRDELNLLITFFFWFCLHIETHIAECWSEDHHPSPSTIGSFWHFLDLFMRFFSSVIASVRFFGCFDPHVSCVGHCVMRDVTICTSLVVQPAKLLSCYLLSLITSSKAVFDCLRRELC